MVVSYIRVRTRTQTFRRGCDDDDEDGDVRYSRPSLSAAPSVTKHARLFARDEHLIARAAASAREASLSLYVYIYTRERGLSGIRDSEKREGKEDVEGR